MFEGFFHVAGLCEATDGLPMNPLRYFRPLIASVLLVCARADEVGPPVPPPGDSTLKIDRTVAIQYPVSLMRDGVAHGEARVLVNIDADGRLTESMVLGYTHEPFATAALEAIRQWHFEPARLHGEKVGTVADLTFRFEVDGVLMVQRAGVPVFQKQSTFDNRYAYQPYDLSMLDRIPTPLHVTEPIFPREWSAQGIRGKVTIDFYIDESGAVRMPSLVTTSHPLLAAAATAAIREWRFDPPLRKGRPVLAHCEQVFTFERDPTQR
jgi:TonB family protein